MSGKVGQEDSEISRRPELLHKNVNQKIENGKLQMKHFNSIKKNSDFQKVYKTGKSYANRLLVMYVKEKNGGDTRIGISVSKKVGNSVVRHHVTRLVRESFRLHQDMVRAGLDIVVVARAAAREAEYKQIESAYLHLCGLHNILENRSEKID